MSGASSQILHPASHLSSQKRARRPSPTLILVAAVHSAREAAGTSMLNSAHGLSLSVFCSHGHRACRALFNQLRLGIPSPPAHLGLQTLSQATAQCPPVASFFPHHRNPRQILVSALIVFAIFFDTSVVLKTFLYYRTERVKKTKCSHAIPPAPQDNPRCNSRTLLTSPVEVCNCLEYA